MRTIVLDGEVLANQETAQEYLREMLEFPDYYGKNLDAVYDCLTDFDEIEIQIRITALQHESVYLNKILRVFQDASEENERITVKFEMES